MGHGSLVLLLLPIYIKYFYDTLFSNKEVRYRLLHCFLVLSSAFILNSETLQISYSDNKYSLEISVFLFGQSNLHLEPPLLGLGCCHIQGADVDFASRLGGGVLRPCSGTR